MEVIKPLNPESLEEIVRNFEKNFEKVHEISMNAHDFADLAVFNHQNKKGDRFSRNNINIKETGIAGYFYNTPIKCVRSLKRPRDNIITGSMMFNDKVVCYHNLSCDKIIPYEELLCHECLIESIMSS